MKANEELGDKVELNPSPCALGHSVSVTCYTNTQMRICTHTCIHAYMHTCIHAYMHTYIHISIYNFSVCPWTFSHCQLLYTIRIYTYSFMNTYIHTYGHTYIYAYIQIHLRIHTYIRTYIHTDIHTLINLYGTMGWL